jgi:hypothetical protein
MPQKWDWTNVHGENWTTPIRDQEDLGTCWAFATNAVLEALVNLKYNEKRDFDLSEQQLVSCIDGSGVHGGSSFAALTYAYETDIVNEECMEYIPSHEYMNECGMEPSEYSPKRGEYEHCISDFEKSTCPDKCSSPSDTVVIEKFWSECKTINVEVENGHVANERYVKLALLIYGPGTIALPSWYHVMAIVGWETSDNGHTVWKIKNSWGEDWGEEGYLRTNLFDEEKIILHFVDELGDVWDSGDLLSEDDIICEDNDGDGYCNWGISKERPESCPDECLSNLRDLDDTDPNSGVLNFDENDLFPPPPPSTSEGETIKSGDTVTLKLLNDYLSINSDEDCMTLGLNANRKKTDSWQRFEINEIENAYTTDVINKGDTISLRPINSGDFVSEELRWLPITPFRYYRWIVAEEGEGKILHFVIYDTHFDNVVSSGDIIELKATDDTWVGNDLYLSFRYKGDCKAGYLSTDEESVAVLTIKKA